MAERRLTGVLWLATWLLVITLSVLAVDLFCVLVLWSPNGTEHLRHVFQHEVALLNLDSTDLAFLAQIAHIFHDKVFVATGLDTLLRNAANPTADNAQTAHDLIASFGPSLETAMIGLQIFALRIGVLMLTLPLFVLATFTATADGLLGWYLRRTGGERESGFIYHRAKRGLAWSFLLLWIVYLIPPVPMDPKYLLPPFLIASGIATRLHVAFFKKYL